MITTKQVEEYTASDGSVFHNKAQAEKHEAEWQAVKPIMDRIPKTELDHGEYVTHDRQLLVDIRRCLWPLIVKKVDAAKSFPRWLEWSPDDVHPMSIVGRVLSDYGGPIDDAWRHLARFCFDTGREFDQPYFVTHQSEAHPKE